MRNKTSHMSLTKAAWMLATALTVVLPQAAGAETVLRIGMTAADIPRTLGQPDQGFEGNRFTGVTMYDALTGWDLSSAEKASVVIPGLATEWKVDEADKTKWTFKLRPGVTFHDGSPFNADAVVWNVDKVLKQDAPQFDASQVGVTASRMPTLASAKKAPTPRRSRRLRGLLLPRTPRAPARGRWRASPRASGSSWSRTQIIGTRLACPRSTRWCSCRCPKPMRAPRRCFPDRSIGSRRRRRMRCPS
jgi:hypothetical protein